MSTANQETTVREFKHRLQISERRRSLFPTDDSDSELGHISPLSFDSNSDTEEYHTVPKGPDSSSINNSIGDYDIIGVVENKVEVVETPLNSKYTACSETMSPLYLSPFTHNSLAVDQTLSKFSPSESLKTPHDTNTKSLNIPRLVRKSISDESGSLKRKTSPLSSPEPNKTLKMDPKCSKVRTALFPPDKCSYLSKEESVLRNLDINKDKIKKPLSFSSSRSSYRSKRRAGQINNGVWHNIRKPKQKKISRTNLVKASKRTIETNSALNNYIQDLSDLNKHTNPLKLIREVQKPEKIHCIKVVPENETNEDTYEKKLSSQRIVEEKETNSNKKFFKFSRTKATVTVSKNIKLTVDNGKIALLEKHNKRKGAKINLDVTDLITEEDEDQMLPKPNIDNILSALDDESTSSVETPSNQIVLEAHSSVSASENSILLHTQPKNVADILLSPISQMCDVTSGLALNSPKRSCNLNSVLNNMPNAGEIINQSFDSVDMETKKLYPIFSGRKRSIPEKHDDKENKNEKRPPKRFRGLSENQMLLDAGQKRFGVTVCAECNIIYHMGDPGDEAMHLNYHNAVNVLKFVGWKNECIMSDFNKNGRIIRVLPNDSKIWVKKVKDLMQVINRDLGCYDMEFNISGSQVYLYIKNRTIAGCAVAVVPNSGGHRMLTSNLCSEETYPVKCGISRIWVAVNYRKQGIATALMNSIKSNFVFGHVLTNNDLAITSPTDLGAIFAEKYFKTTNYLIYYS